MTDSRFHEMHHVSYIGLLCLLLAVCLGACDVLEEPTAQAPMDDRLFPVQIDGRWGYVDAEGRIAIPPRFDAAGDFADGRAAVRIGTNWGYIDAAAAFVVEPQYRIAGDYTEGYAAVIGQGFSDTYTYIDPQGVALTDLPIELAQPFSESRAAVRINQQWGYLDTDGTLSIPATFSDARSFAEGRAAVETGDGWVYIDTEGAVVIRPDFAVSALGDFGEGLAPFSTSAGWGYLDAEGRPVIPPRYEAAGPFSEGLAAVQEGDRVHYIDATGTPVIKAAFTAGQPFSEGFAAVRLGNRWTYVRRADGLVAFTRLFSRAEAFESGIARVYFDEEDRLRIGYLRANDAFIWYPTR